MRYLPIGDEAIQMRIAQQIQDEGWSVRATEAYVSDCCVKRKKKYGRKGRETSAAKSEP